MNDLVLDEQHEIFSTVGGILALIYDSSIERRTRNNFSLHMRYRENPIVSSHRVFSYVTVTVVPVVLLLLLWPSAAG